MRSRTERSVPARPTRLDRPTGHRLVPLERLGLHTQTCHHDDQATRTTAHDTSDLNINVLIYFIHEPTNQLNWDIFQDFFVVKQQQKNEHRTLKQLKKGAIYNFFVTNFELISTSFSATVLLFKYSHSNIKIYASYHQKEIYCKNPNHIQMSYICTRNQQHIRPSPISIKSTIIHYSIHLYVNSIHRTQKNRKLLKLEAN
jgi:hypothetical protein